MRDLIYDAVAQARELAGKVVGDLREQNRLTDDEVLAQYEQHREDPLAKVAFVQQQTGLDGPAVVMEALRYEDEMEKLRARRMGSVG